MAGGREGHDFRLQRFVFVFFEDMHNNATFPGIREEACGKAFVVNSEDDAQGFAAKVGECIYE